MPLPPAFLLWRPSWAASLFHAVLRIRTQCNPLLSRSARNTRYLIALAQSIFIALSPRLICEFGSFPWRNASVFQCLFKRLSVLGIGRLITKVFATLLIWLPKPVER